MNDSRILALTDGSNLASNVAALPRLSRALDRRAFLHQCSVAVAAAALGGLATSPTGSSAASAKKRVLKKGLMYGAVSGEKPVQEKFNLIKLAGFDGVEVNSHMNQTEVLKARDASGLEIPSVCGALHWDKPLSDPDPMVRAAGLEALKQSLRDAKAYGASSVLLVPAVVTDRVTYADAYSRSQEAIRMALPMAEDLGVRIAIENVWNDFLLSPLEAARYVDEFGTDAVGWHFDAGNIARYGWPDQWIRILNRRIVKLHLKEFSRQKMEKEGLWAGFNVDYLDGDMSWPVVMRALDEIGYRGWAIAEPAYTPPGKDLPTRLREIVERMDRIIAS